MKILFTGGSSLTGMWFIHELVRAGHDVTATLRKPLSGYNGTRLQRVQTISSLATISTCSFGDPEFVNLVRGSSWDIFCHHAAEVTNYKRADFNVEQAVENNTHNLVNTLASLRQARCLRIVLTGTVFEPFEGAGDQLAEAVSPYGLSKGKTATLFQKVALDYGIALGKFVIANPFGPFEEERFTTYLAKRWLSGQDAVVDYPDYVRDNIPVTLLARAYRSFVEKQLNKGGMEKFCPKGYSEPQGIFTERFARELGPRMGVTCNLEFKKQTAFPEPKVRLATDALDWMALGWDESLFWDELARYYKETYGHLH